MNDSEKEKMLCCILPCLGSLVQAAGLPLRETHTGGGGMQGALPAIQGLEVAGRRSLHVYAGKLGSWELEENFSH